MNETETGGLITLILMFAVLAYAILLTLVPFFIWRINSKMSEVVKLLASIKKAGEQGSE